MIICEFQLCRQNFVNFYLPPFTPSLCNFLNVSEISAHLKLASVKFSSLPFVFGDLEERFPYPGPRGFSWFFFAKEIKRKPQSGDDERAKNLWLPWPRISLSCRRQGQDLTLGRWLVDIFSNTQTNLIGLFNFNYRGDAEDFHTSFKFRLSLPGKEIVCILHSQ